MSVQNTLTAKLTTAFKPDHIEVRNDSHQHNVPIGSESHFRVTLVTASFVNKRLIARHRAVNTVLAEELAGAVHALALHTYTPAEWAKVHFAPEPPDCLGGESGAGG